MVFAVKLEVEITVVSVFFAKDFPTGLNIWHSFFRVATVKS
jgi:hypothetical protein